MSPNDFSLEIQTRLLHFLWRQWGQLGVASANVPKRDGWAIDPEALWLFSSSLARYDARLFDEIIDWLVINSAFINMPRLKSIQRKQQLGDLNVVAAMADTVSRHNSRLNWRFDSHAWGNRKQQSLFLSDGLANMDFGPRDEIFIKYQLVRGKLELRRLSRAFNRVMPECILLRLRSIFGVSARAEIVLYLLTHDIGHPSQIAKETSFSQKNIQDTLVDMSASGVIQSGPLEGRRKSYYLVNKFDTLLLPSSIDPPLWITWAPLFTALDHIRKRVYEITQQNISATLLSSEFRQLAIDAQHNFQLAGFASAISDHRPYTGTAYLDVFINDIDALLKRLGA